MNGKSSQVTRASPSGALANDRWAAFRFVENLPAADKKYGFPENVQKAFLLAAGRTRNVVLSRVPGEACNQLIDDRYDLKSYFIKAKSCDWGPWAGFVCMTPYLNKDGVSKAMFNADMLRDYLLVLYYMKTKHRNPVMHPPAVDASDVALRQLAFERGTYPDYPVKLDPNLDKDKQAIQRAIGPAFIPLLITDTRKNSLFRPDAPPDGWRAVDPRLWKVPRNPGSWRVPSDSTVVGIARDYPKSDPPRSAPPTVAVEFVLKQRVPGTLPPLWEVYFGPVYIRPQDAWQLAAPNPLLGPDVRDGAPCHRVSDVERVALDDAHSAFQFDKLPRPSGGQYVNVRFYPVMALQNPYPPQELDGPFAYRNAISGDFDLLAVWPVSPVPGLRRVSEYRYPPPGQPQADADARVLQPGEPLFLPVDGKALSIESNRVRGLYLEFVPDSRVLLQQKLEDDSWGNPHNAVLDVIGYLNDAAAEIYREHRPPDDPNPPPRGKPPNQAFHSDEGGRPDITEIDLPFAVFLPPDSCEEVLPPELRDKKKKIEKNPFCIEDPADVLRLIAGLAGKCFMPVQASWVYDVLVRNKAKKVEVTGQEPIASQFVQFLLTGKLDGNLVAPAVIAALKLEVLKALKPPDRVNPPDPTTHDLGTPEQQQGMIDLTLQWRRAALELRVPSA